MSGLRRWAICSTSSTSTSIYLTATLTSMARPKLKIKLAASVAILLAVGLAILLTQSGPAGRLKLPVGHGTPAISLGERHGLILASDGSLWSWGSDFLGWPVLGLGNLVNK